MMEGRVKMTVHDARTGSTADRQRWRGKLPIGEVRFAGDAIHEDGISRKGWTALEVWENKVGTFLSSSGRSLFLLYTDAILILT